MLTRPGINHTLKGKVLELPVCSDRAGQLLLARCTVGNCSETRGVPERILTLLKDRLEKTKIRLTLPQKLVTLLILSLELQEEEDRSGEGETFSTENSLLVHFLTAHPARKIVKSELILR